MHIPARSLRSLGATAILLAAVSVLLLALQGYAELTDPHVNLMNIHDDAHVLNQDRVIQAADGVGYNIDLYTTGTFTGDAAALAAFAHGRFTTHQRGMLVLVVDTLHRRLAIQDNGMVPTTPVSFSGSQYRAAQDAFRAAMAAHDFTTATAAALQALAHANSANRTQAYLSLMRTILIFIGLPALIFGGVLFFLEGKGQTGAPFRRGGPKTSRL